MELQGDLLFWLGLLLFVGYLAGLAVEKLGLPKATGFMAAGIGLGPAGVGLFPKGVMDGGEMVIGLSLAVIAFVIGGSLRLKILESLGRGILTITLVQGVGAFVVAAAGVGGFLFYAEGMTAPAALAAALALGALASATDPAAILAVVHEKRAGGRFVESLLSIVALDDVLALLFFVLAAAGAGVLLGTEQLSLAAASLEAAGEVAGSLAAGGLAGWAGAALLDRPQDERLRMLLVFGLLFLLYALLEEAGLDGMLGAMALGTLLANRTALFDKVERALEEQFLDLIFPLFFIVSGTFLELSAMEAVWPLLLVYLVFRALGKIGGVRAGAFLAGSDGPLARYGGWALIPQGGVVVGLALSLYHQSEFGALGAVIVNVMIAAVALEEVFGPLLVKMALERWAKEDEHDDQ